MFSGRQRGRKLSAISFLFVMAVCAAFAAHERLHDLELAEEGHASNHHDGVIHSHPGVAATNQPLDDKLVRMGAVEAPSADPVPTQDVASPRLLRPGPRVADDVGLHDLLSVYRI